MNAERDSRLGLGLRSRDAVDLLRGPVATVRIAISKLRKFVQNLKYQIYAEKSPVTNDFNPTPEHTFLEVRYGSFHGHISNELSDSLYAVLILKWPCGFEDFRDGKFRVVFRPITRHQVLGTINCASCSKEALLLNQHRQLLDRD